MYLDHQDQLCLFLKSKLHQEVISITHKDVTRYFMTIPEAAQLVIQASYLSQGGEIFLLDMGKPVKIIDLAAQMIKLSGKTIKNKDNLDGDLDIVFTGLRPGEKLYEVLIIDAKSESSIHPLIFKANENFIPFDQLIPALNDLEDKILSFELGNTLQILKKLVPEWNTENSNIVKKNIKINLFEVHLGKPLKFVDLIYHRHMDF